MTELSNDSTSEYSGVVQQARMGALTTLAEPLIGDAAAAESLARMIERIGRKEVGIADLRSEIISLYATPEEGRTKDTP